MMKYDPTSLMRKMIYRPNMTAVAGIVAIIFAAYFYCYLTSPGHRNWMGVEPHHVKYDSYIFHLYFPTVYIYADGDIYFYGSNVEDLKDLSLKLREHIIDGKYENRIYIKGSRHAPFDKIRKVMIAAQKANIDEVVFLTQPKAKMGEFWAEGKNPPLIKEARY